MIEIKTLKVNEGKKLKTITIISTLLIGLFVIFIASAPTFVKAAEDNYEENDGWTSAYDIDSNAGNWLSEINGLGYQNDEDWYEIDLALDRLVIYFIGDITIQLSREGHHYDYTYDNDDFRDELLDVEPTNLGVWYIRITGTNGGNSYDIYWDNVVSNPQDNYEQNDDYSTAYDITSNEDLWLSRINGLGTNSPSTGGDDWFKYTINPYNLRAQINLKHWWGLFDLELYDTDGTTLLASDSSTTSPDDLSIDFTVDAPGVYYVRVDCTINNHALDFYDLKWNEMEFLWDDNYEDNDHRGEAFENLYENTWLSSVDGLGIQSDDDYYKITIDRPDKIFNIECTFTHADNNIDIALYDYYGTLLTESTTTTNNENINYEIVGVHKDYWENWYYIKVYGQNYPSEYNLRWNAIPPSDDNYEPNDSFNDIYDFSSHEDIWLSNIDGDAISLDQDWYRIHVENDERNLAINCTFIHNYGDINMELYDDSESLITESSSTNDNEIINYVVPAGGSYYIKLFQEHFSHPSWYDPNYYDLKWETNIPIEDNYEENDDLASSYDLSLNESVWLDEINGTGRNVDEDWYKIFVPLGAKLLQAECTFTHSLGDIDMALYDASETLITQSTSSSDNEFIDRILTGAAYYYIKIFGKTYHSGNEYNLRWALAANDDNYEENDNLATAYNLSLYNSTQIDGIDGHGRQGDDDWYEIYVPSEAPYLEIECTFSHDQGDIDIGLYYFNGTEILSSTSSNDNEFIAWCIKIAGFYYIKVFGANLSNQYNLKWTAQLDSTPPIWLDPITNQEIVVGADFTYKVNATDTCGIKEYLVNDTINFIIDSNGLLENKTSLMKGIYWIKITVVDNFNNQISADMRILVHVSFLSVTIDTNATHVELYEFINFSCSILDHYPPCSFHWWFDDGNESYEENPIHSFSEEGIYNVTISITDDLGISGTHYILITVSDTANNPDIPGIPGYSLLFPVFALALAALIVSSKKKLKI
ncbi:MAG: exported protein of unknown function [Promethearchaeota archaeon]|nr:MAG: exported protein of unknown function [Candidatus Lokiarchaeota archaeon]